MSDSTFPMTEDMPPSPAVPLPPATSLPPVRYELLDEIARGGMGVVVRAHDRTLNRDLAVKILHEEFVRRPDVINRFLDEAQIAGQLQHPGIVPIHEIGILPDGRPAIAMKLVKGRTLSAIMRERPAPDHDRPRFIAIFEQICQTIAYAHSKGVIHRDLKPLNIMVGAFGEVQVMDWGLAKVLGDGSACVRPSAPEIDVTLASVVETARSRDDTQAGSALGTFSYMPPEQARGEVDRLDRRSDVFGLGAVLCEILTGEPPYVGPTFAAVRRQALVGDLTDAAARLDGCGADPQLIALAKSCLAAEPDARPDDAGAVAASLADHLASVQERLRQADLDRARAETRRAEQQKRKRILGALAAAVLLAVAIGIAAWMHNRDVQASHQAQAVARVNELVGKASSLREQARAVVLTDANKRQEAAMLWDQSLKSATDAEAELAKESVDATTASRIAEFSSALKSEASDARRDLKMLSQLEMGFDQRAVIRDSDYDRIRPKAVAVFGHGGAEVYEAAFREYGIDVLKLDPQEVGKRVRERKIRDPLVAALNDWCNLESDRVEIANRLLTACRAADPDPFRERLRTAAVAQDASALKALAHEPEALNLQTPTAVLLAESLQQLGEAATAVPLFEELQRRHPDDFWINDVLGVLLMQTDLSRTQESIAYFRAALAARPNYPVIYDNLARALSFKGQYTRAIETVRAAIDADPKFVKTRLTLADILAEQGFADQGVAECREVVRLSPDFAFGRVCLAMHLANQGELIEAEKVCREALRMKANLAYCHVWLGLILAKQQRCDEALTVLNEADRLFPEMSDIQFAIAAAYARKGEWNKAVDAYRKAIKLRPDYLAAYSDMRIALSKAGQHREAVLAAREALRLQPDRAYNYAALGDSLSDMKLNEEALVAVREAIRIDPKLAAAHNAMGNIFDRQGKFDDAAEAYSKAIAIQPDLAVCHSNLGSTLSHKHDHAGAIVAFREAMRLAPKEPSYGRSLALALEDQGDRTAAIECCRAALELDRADANSWNILGNLYWRGDDAKQAADAYREAVKLKPDDAQFHDNLGSALRLLGKFEEAIAEHREALRLSPMEISFGVNLGMALKQQGKVDEAIAVFQTLIRLKQDDPGAHNQLGHALERAGRLDDAERAFRDTAVLKPNEAWVYENIGRVCFRRRQLDEAVLNLRKSLELNAKSPPTLSWLGASLRNQGQFDDAIVAFKKWRELAPERTDVPFALRQCERLAALEPRIDGFASGDVKPATDEKRLDAAFLCYYKRRYEAAVRLFEGVVAARAPDANNTDFIYAAAGAAMRASMEAKDDAERSRLRRLALSWLRTMLVQANKFEVDRDEIGDWLYHPAFAGVREPTALANIPSAERAEWEKLWSDVVAFRKQPRP